MSDQANAKPGEPMVVETVHYDVTNNYPDTRPETEAEVATLRGIIAAVINAARKPLVEELAQASRERDELKDRLADAAKELKNEIATAVAEVWAECVKITDVRKELAINEKKTSDPSTSEFHYWQGVAQGASNIACLIRSRSAQPFTPPAPKAVVDCPTLPAKVEGWFTSEHTSPTFDVVMSFLANTNKLPTEIELLLRPLCLAVAEAAREEERNSPTVPTMWLNHHDKRVAEEERKRIAKALRKRAPLFGGVNGGLEFTLANEIEANTL
jgi:hypothetical protein